MTLIPILAATALLAGCAAGPMVQTDADPKASFSGYRTYAWVYQAAPRRMDPRVYERVRGSIDRELAGLGFTRAEKADFAVAFTIGVRNKVEAGDFGPYGPYASRWGFGWGGYNRTLRHDYREYTADALVIDVYDARTRKPVWHGLASRDVNPDVGQDLIDQMVAGVLARFPAEAPNSPPI